MPRSKPWIVYPVLAFGVASFASSSILVRFADDGPGLAIAVWRTWIAALLLTPVLLPRVAGELKRFTAPDWKLIGLSGVLLGLHFVLWIESLYHTSVASSSALVTTSPIFLALFGYLFLRERLRPWQVASVLCAVGGAVLISRGDSGAGPGAHAALGNTLALTAALIVSVYMLIGRVVRRRVSWGAYIYPLYVVVALVTLTAALVRGTPLWGYPIRFYLLCAAMAVGPQIIGHGAMNFGLRYFPAAYLGVLGLLEPVGASLLAVVLFGEQPGPIAVLGIAVVLLGVLVNALAGRKPAPAPTGSSAAAVR